LAQVVLVERQVAIRLVETAQTLFSAPLHPQVAEVVVALLALVNAGKVAGQVAAPLESLIRWYRLDLETLLLQDNSISRK
jgi:hypothetical protein